MHANSHHTPPQFLFSFLCMHGIHTMAMLSPGSSGQVADGGIWLRMATNSIDYSYFLKTVFYVCREKRTV